MALVGFIPSPSSGSISIGPLDLRAYGLMIALGVIAAVWLWGRRVERNDIAHSSRDRFVRAMHQAIPPQGLARHDHDAFADLADAAGFRGALDGLLDGRRTPRHALVLGAGGAAKAAISALVTAGVAQISIANRHLARAERLVAEVRKASPHLTVRAAPWHEGLLVEEAQIAGLVVHATTLGLNGGALPLPAAAFRAGQFVIDVVYAPGETALVRTARAAGAEAIDGREMLLLQGAAAFEMWTGRPAPLEVMRAAFDAAAGHTQK
jgi:shikimate dehydrogenase